MNFNEIIGHKRQIESLKNSIRKNNISHSYLFEGEEGLGKKKVAMVFSKALLCKEGLEEPCNVCSSCIKFDRNNHPDFKIIRDDKGIIKKEEIDNLIKSASTAPFESKRKIFLIDNSHTMNLEGMNALLKTLEEPPNFMNMILITSMSNSILPTILSRCQRIGFYPVENSQIVELLMNKYSINMEKSKFISDFTKGSVGKSIEISSSEDFFQRRDEIINMINEILEGDRTKALSGVKFFEKNKADIEDILDIMLYWFRDLLIYKEVRESELIINKDKFEILSRQTSIDYNRINDIMKNIERTRTNIKNNINFTLSIETMLLNI